MADSFRLYLFGGFRLEPNGARVQLYSRKVESLLAYLVLYPQEHAREKLAALFWGESTDEQARGSLRRALNNLRQQLGADALFADRETVQFNPDFFLWCDAVEFKKPDAESKIQNYSGELLSDFYDDWIFPLREEYRAQHLDALVYSIEYARAASEYTQAIALAQKILAIERAHEEAHQHLMFCYAALGNRGAALEQYEACRTALREELGVEPSKETRALHASILKKEETGSRAARLTNLPKPLTSFVGREQQLVELGQLTLTSRLVTLTGAGGSGKTRLAIQIGHQLYEQYADGVWFVDFAPLTDSELVPQQVAKTLSVQEQPQRAVTETLIQFLENKSLLLILDNCEHLVHACATLAETLVTQCGMLQLLATSREPLGIGGETVWRVPTLAVPSPQEFTEWLMQYEAVRLFVERARTVNARFALDEPNAAAVARICQRLDGIPLAIELAAARTNVLRPDQIAARLDDRFGLLTSGSRTALPRQQTLRALIDWSYDLLSEDERVLLRRLSVFAGGCTLEAAESVCSMQGAESSIDVELLSTFRLLPSEILDLVSHLVDKSLIIVDKQGGETRYHMQETIRQYAHEKLLEAGEAERLRYYHLEFVVRLVEEAAPHLRSAQQVEWMKRLDQEYENVQVAFDYARDSAQAESELRMVGALDWFWIARAYFQQERERAEGALLRSGKTRTLIRANALCAAAHLAVRQSDLTPARLYLEESLDIFRELGNKRGMVEALTSLSHTAVCEGNFDLARTNAEEALALCSELGQGGRSACVTALYRLGQVALNQGNYNEARTHNEQSLGLAKESGDLRGMAFAVGNLGLIAMYIGEYEAARSYYQDALVLSTELGDRWANSVWLANLGVIARDTGDFVAARSYFESSLRVTRDLSDKRSIADTTYEIAEIMRLEGDYERAAFLFDESLRLSRELSDRDPYDSKLLVGQALDGLAHLAYDQSSYSRAALLFRESLSLFAELGENYAIANSLDGLAAIAISSEEWGRAARLFGGAEMLREAFGLHVPPYRRREYDTNVNLLRTKLGNAFRNAWEEGRIVPLDQAIACALEQNA